MQQRSKSGSSISPCIWAIACAVGFSQPVFAQPKAATMYQPRKKLERIPRQPYERYETTDSLDRIIQFYVSEEPPGPILPLIVYVHGSGATSHFVREGNRIAGRNGHNTVRDVAAGRARLVIVEKPGVEYLANLSPGGSAEGASQKFRIEHTLDRWVEAVHAALQASRRISGIDSNRVLVVGHSEGGLVAAMVAGRQTGVTHVGLLAGGGPTQLYDLLEFARRGIFFSERGSTVEARERYVIESWERIIEDPENADSIFFGHPYRRWSSFLTQSPMAVLPKTRAKIYLAQGTRDNAVTLESFEMLCAHLRSLGAQVDCDRVEGADHNFTYNVGEGPADGWAHIWLNIITWFIKN